MRNLFVTISLTLLLIGNAFAENSNTSGAQVAPFPAPSEKELRQASIRIFTPSDEQNVFSTTDSWASKSSFRVRPTKLANQRLYKRGYGILIAPIIFSVEQKADTYRLQAYVKPDMFTRLSTFFLIPSKMNLDSGHFVGILPRAVGRKSVNKLLTELKQPLIW